jgi:hypothetical protein
MKNLTIKIKTTKTHEVETEISLPKYFTLNSFCHYKVLSDSAVIMVNYYTSDLKNITALELFPSIRVEHIRYVSYLLKEDNMKEITEKEFETHLNDAKKLIWSL